MNPHKETVTLLVPENSEFAKKSAVLGYTRAQLAAIAVGKYGYNAREINGSEFQCIISRIDTRFGEVIEKLGLTKKQEGKES